MAVDVCSDVGSPGISPRISFSHDLKDTGSGGARPDTHLLDDSGADFDFCIGAAFFELSSAEELFSDGKILPGEIKTSRSLNSDHTHDGSPAAVPPPPRHSEKKKRLKEFLSASSDTDETEDSPTPPPPQRSFWQFSRSSSLNCDAATRNKTLIRSLHFMSRSNSTGSAPNPKQNLKRQPSVSSRRSTSFSSSSSSSGSSSFGMPYTYKKHYGNGIKINPVLNFQPHIGTGTLFGFGSLFCSGKVRRKKKK